jgi:PPM family protein phosphatase
LIDVVHIIAEGLSDIGKKRKDNQDAFGVEEDLGFFIVADGIGGLERGSFASKYVVSELCKSIREKRCDKAKKNEVLTFINDSISELSNTLNAFEGGNIGSTIVLALLLGRSAYMAHLGDSRAYLLRGNILKRLTKDHNLASLLLDEGVINSRDALSHPLRHVLTKFVGMKNATPDIEVILLEPGDRLLLCTDGFSGTIEDDEIASILLESNELNPVLKKIISKANEAGGNDNITALLIDFEL